MNRDILNFEHKNFLLNWTSSTYASSQIRLLYILPWRVRLESNQRTLTIAGRITVQLVSSLTRLELTNEGNIIFLYLVKQSNATL